MKWKNRILDISMIPKTVELDRHTLLPQSLNRKYGYGKRFNAFVVQDDLYFHRSTCKNIKNSRKKLVHKYLAVNNCYACPVCTPVAQIDDWYWDFLQTNFGKFESYEEFQTQFELPSPASVTKIYNSQNT